MPLCTSCTFPVEHLYTVYSKHNIRLEQCSNCHAFADTYVEHDWLTITLDLILLKPGVYRHLLFNRGSQPRYIESSSNISASEGQIIDQDRARWRAAILLGFTLVTLDAYIRWLSQYPTARPTSQFWTSEAGTSLLRTWFGCMIETAAFDSGILVACFSVKWALARPNRYSISSTRDQLRASHVPLTVIYSSFTKLFLLFLLSIWRSSISDTAESTSLASPASLPSLFDSYPWVRAVLEVFDENKLDREWVVRNLIGGMAAGFGLRVVLDCPAAITTLVVIFGWAIKSFVAWSISGWAGHTNKHWIAYSIP